MHKSSCYHAHWTPLFPKESSLLLQLFCQGEANDLHEGDNHSNIDGLHMNVQRNLARIARFQSRLCSLKYLWSAWPKPPLIGHLPPEHVTPDIVFGRIGVDYAGPILINLRAVQRPTLVKAYIAIFCFADSKSYAPWGRSRFDHKLLPRLFETLCGQMRWAWSVMVRSWYQLHWR